MTTGICELVVTLAFESGDATASMRAMQHEIGNIDKDFQAVDAEADNLRKGLDSAKLKAQSLTQQPEMQNRIVAESGKLVGAAGTKLQEAQKRQQDYAAKVKDATDAHEKLKAELAAVKASGTKPRRPWATTATSQTSWAWFTTMWIRR